MSTERRSHLLSELGFAVSRAGEGLSGRAEVRPPMHGPGTGRLRTSILAVWVDQLTGLLAAESLRPRVPVTIELDVHLYEPAPAAGFVEAAARVVKRGRTVFVAEVEFRTGDGDLPFAVGAASFMASPNQDARLPASLSIDVPPPPVLLSVPLAERAGLSVRELGTAELAAAGPETRNSSGTVNGGLIALVAEEAALSVAPGSLSSFSLRYLQAVRVGPTTGTARFRAGLGQVDVRDEGNENRLCAVATVRSAV